MGLILSADGFLGWGGDIWGWGGGYLKPLRTLLLQEHKTVLKKSRCRTKKKPIKKKSHRRTSFLKNGLTKLPCFLKILASCGDFFTNGQLLYPFSDHTMQCCTRKPFWVAKLEPQSCSASAFPYFEADAELGVVTFLLLRFYFGLYLPTRSIFIVFTH